jgi:hypothetical protein
VDVVPVVVECDAHGSVVDVVVVWAEVVEVDVVVWAAVEAVLAAAVWW